MADAKEVKGKIRSVENTQKITKAMEMVSASKMRKAQNRMRTARPYADKIERTIGHLTRANPYYRHPFLIERDAVKRVGMLVISTDRGLCGGLNVNLFRKVLTEMQAWHKQGVEVDIAVVGRKAQTFFRRLGSIEAEVSGLSDKPKLETLLGTVRVMLDAYSDGTIDQLFVFSNKFVNTMTQQPHVHKLLPTQPSDDDRLARQWDYLYEPDAGELLDTILMRYVESQVYLSVVENIACERAARMIAMKAASDNAGQIIDDLELQYNKARQAAITQELSEIVSGASAVS